MLQITRKILSHQCRKPHCGNETILWRSYIHDGTPIPARRHSHTEAGCRWSQISSWENVLISQRITLSVYQELSWWPPSCCRHHLVLSLYDITWCMHAHVTFSSLAALEIVKMTTSSAASDENIIKMMTFLFQYGVSNGKSCTPKFTLVNHSACMRYGLIPLVVNKKIKKENKRWTATCLHFL